MDQRIDSEAAATAVAAAGNEEDEVESAAPPAAAELAKPAGQDDEEQFLSRARRLASRIALSLENPSPKHMHALASIVETAESRYHAEFGHSIAKNGRASHTIGKLANIIMENDELLEAISSRFLSEHRYSISIRAAAARLLLSHSTSCVIPLALEDAILENVKGWVMEDTIGSSDDGCNWKQEMGASKATDFDMLKTYASGLLLVSLAFGGQVVESVLSSGVPNKLMHFLRARTLGDSCTAQEDACFSSKREHAFVYSSLRDQEETKGSLKEIIDANSMDEGRIEHKGSLSNMCSKWGNDMTTVNGLSGGELLMKPHFTYSSVEAADLFGMSDRNLEVAGNGHNGRSSLHDETNEDFNLPVHGINQGTPKNPNRPITIENPLGTERCLPSLSAASEIGVLGGCSGEKYATESNCTEGMVDRKTFMSNNDLDCPAKIEYNDDHLYCIGSVDISHLVNKAKQAAETEARAVNASAGGIKAAGDAAAELVKTSALEVWESTNNIEDAILAASSAASTVIDAAKAYQLSSSVTVKIASISAVDPEMEEDLEDLVIGDAEVLARMREKHSIMSLDILGQYVEALGPILHEKGVDVCLALLQQRNEKLDELSLVLKLISTLAAHRKFAAMFVDRGGMRLLLSVKRVSETFFGLSSCLSTIGSLQGIMERVCALPSEIIYRVVELALQLFECSQEQARKNAAIFFAAAFVFRAILDSFDAQDGLQKFLYLLQNAAFIRSGGSSAASTGLRNGQSASEVLTALDKQIAYHTCVALRQFFRAQLLVFVDTFRSHKIGRSAARNNPSVKTVNKPFDISNEGMDAVFLQIQHDKKLGPALVRSRWHAADKFMLYNGHITMLELCQAPQAERYLHDLGQYALGVLHVITLVPKSRTLIINAALSNDRVGMAVILDAANCIGYTDPELIYPALNCLVNLICPPPSISSKTGTAQGQQSISVKTPNGSVLEKDRQLEKTRSVRDITLPTLDEKSVRNLEVDSAGRTSASTPCVPKISSGVIGDRRISLGSGAGCAGLATQLEQGYRQAREAVRASNGIKVLLHLLQPRTITPPGALDCLRALVCQVLIGLARDSAIAHILTKLQVGKRLSELIRDLGSQSSGTNQDRWQTELGQVAMELIAIITNSGRATSSVTTDATAPTLKRIEREAIASATPITYHSRELLLLVHEHLQACGMTGSAALLQKEACLAPLPSIARRPPLHQISNLENTSLKIQWPSGRASCGFQTDASKITRQGNASGCKSHSTLPSSQKKQLALSSKKNPYNLMCSNFKSPSAPSEFRKYPILPLSMPSSDAEDPLCKTPILLLPMKRKSVECMDSASSAKRIATEKANQTSIWRTPRAPCKSPLAMDTPGLFCTPVSALQCSNKTMSPINCFNNIQHTSSLVTSSIQSNQSCATQPGNIERTTLDSLVVQYLKHQHRQCSAPVTTLPPLSLLHPHVCPEPSRILDAPVNLTARMSTREFRKYYGSIPSHRRDRQLVYSRFRPWRTIRDDATLLSCLCFLGGHSRIATGGHSGELKIFDSNSGSILESYSAHSSAVVLVQSAFSGENQLILSSGTRDVKLWDASSISTGHLHSFEGCKAARYNHSGSMFAAISSDTSRHEILLYDIQKCDVEQKFHDNSSSTRQNQGHVQSLVHFNQLDIMMLWNGILWDRRCPDLVHRFDQFTDYGGGGFHPAGNEVIINSEVWDLRKFKLLRSVPSLNQTVINFNAGGDVIYAILRRNLEDITSAIGTRRVKNPLFPAFRTIDAVSYIDIATIPVDRCVLDFATETTDSFVGVVTMDDHDDMYSSARLYEIGKRRPADDDSDPDDGVDSDEDDSEEDIDSILDPDSDDDSDNEIDVMSVTDDDDLEIGSGDEDDGDDDQNFNSDEEDSDGQWITDTGSDDYDTDVQESLGNE